MSGITPIDTVTEIEKRYLPTELRTDPRFNVRPFSEDCADEDERIENLARTMERDGQLEALLVTSDLPVPIVVCGHRRRRAALVINQKLTALGRPLFRLRVAVVSGGDLRRKGLMSNLHREGESPMDMALNIVRIRQENNWHGVSFTKKVADYLGKSPSYVAQYERFNSVPKEIQNHIHSGRISVDTALYLIKEYPKSPDRILKVIEHGATLQEEDRLEKILDDHDRGRISPGRASQLLGEVTRRRVERPAIVKAIRETCTTTPRETTLSRIEIVRSIGQFDAPAYPDPVRALAHYWTTKHVLGKGSKQELESLLLALCRKPVQSEGGGRPEAIAV